MKSDKKNYNPIAEAYKLIVDFHCLGKAIDFNKVIGYLGEALEVCSNTNEEEQE